MIIKVFYVVLLILITSNQIHKIGGNMYYGKTNKSFAVRNILANSSEYNQFPSSITSVNMTWERSKYSWQKQVLIFLFFTNYLKSSYMKVLPPNKLGKTSSLFLPMDQQWPTSYLNLSVLLTISTVNNWLQRGVYSYLKQT